MNSYEKDLNWIKRKYGEKMMHLCRDNFSRLFDVEGLVPSLLEKNFYQYHNLAQEIIEQNKINDFYLLKSKYSDNIQSSRTSSIL